MENLSNILADLKKINDSTNIECWIPSVGRTAPFKLMSVKQQQDIIKTLSNNTVDNIRTINAVNEILMANCTSEKLNIIDRDVVLLQYRINDASVSEEEKERITAALDAFKIKYAEADVNNFEANRFEKYGIKIKVAIPSIERDTQFNTAFIDVLAPLKNKDAIESLPVLYMLQIIKFIEQIDTPIFTFKFDNFKDVSQYRQIIENIPTDLNSLILNYAKKVQATFIDAIKAQNIELQSTAIIQS